MKLYPYDVPKGSHPYAWVFYGFGLDAATINLLCRHLFDQLGARLETPDAREVTLAWAVDWPLDVSARDVVSVGDDLDVGVGFDTAVTIIDGALPPGIRLVPHTGRLVGRFKQAGLYSVTLRLAPKVKYDPLGGAGGLLPRVDDPGDRGPAAVVGAAHHEQAGACGVQDDGRDARHPQQLVADPLAQREDEVRGGDDAPPGRGRRGAAAAGGGGDGSRVQPVLAAIPKIPRIAMPNTK